MKKVIILGGGESGIGAALLAKKNGDHVFVSDFNMIKETFKDELIYNQIQFEEKVHSEDIILNADLIIKSPGIPNSVDIIKKIKSKNIELISEIEFASRYTNGKVIAISGSNGKTTTTNMIYGILKTAQLDVAMVGNVGKSFARTLTEKDYDYFVTEVSSFQLDNIVSFQPNIAILTNITADHLDRYEYQFENYVASKMRIIENQNHEDVFIYFQDDETLKSIMNEKEVASKIYTYSLKDDVAQGAYLENGTAHITTEQESFNLNLDELGIKGQHNASNTLAASIASSLVNIKSDTIRNYFQTFENLEHRMEQVAFVRGIEFINDSKATNINSVWYALESMKKPVVWIAGGVDKGNDYNEIKSLVKEKVKAIICLGKDNKKLKEYFSNEVPILEETQSIKDAVKMAYELGTNGDVVLFSPACASFDLFENYEDRGNQFKKEVNEI